MTIDKTIYNYSPVTKEFLSVGEGDVYPEDPETLVVPGNATTIVNPSTGANQVAVFDEQTQTWAVLQDFRGETRYSTVNDGAPILIVDIGPIPANTTATPRPDSTYVWNQNSNAWVLNPALQAAANNAILYTEMEAIDLQSIAPIREWLAAQPLAPSEVTDLETDYQDKKSQLDFSYED